MIKYCVSIVVVFIFISCATLINRPTVGINIHSDNGPVKFRMGLDTVKLYETPALVIVPRSKNDLLIFAQKDSVRKLVQINSKLSVAFWLGNICSGIGIIGYAIDLNSPKRFTYPPYVTLNVESQDPNGQYRKWLTPKKGMLNFKLSVPEGNQLYLNKGHGYGNSFGFMGLSGGVEYYLTDKYCLNMDFGGLMDFLIPFPAPVDNAGSYSQSAATYLDLQIGSDYRRFHYDFGIQYNRTSYSEYENTIFPNENRARSTYNKKQNNAGFAISTYYRISNGFNLGLNYYPSGISWYDNSLTMHYSHLIFFELIFKIKAIK